MDPTGNTINNCGIGYVCYDERSYVEKRVH